MFDLNEALNIARREVERAIEADPELDRSEVEEVRLERESGGVWTFTADIPKLICQGWVPGAITVLVDKKDGHILSDEEQVEFHRQWENSRRRAGFLRH